MLNQVKRIYPVHRQNSTWQNNADKIGSLLFKLAYNEFKTKYNKIFLHIAVSRMNHVRVKLQTDT